MKVKLVVLNQCAGYGTEVHLASFFSDQPACQLCSARTGMASATPTPSLKPDIAVA